MNTRDRRLGRIGIVGAVVLLAILGGCNFFGPPVIYDTATASVSIDSGPVTSVTNAPGGPSAAIAGTTSPADIDSITLVVSGEDKYGVFQDPLATTSMTGSGGSWTATVADLPLGPPLTFSIQAFDAGGTLIYTGSTTTVLSAGNLTVAIVLVPYDDGVAILFPVIRQITRPAEIVEGTDAIVSVALEGSSSETLSVDVASGGGIFAPSNPVAVPLSSGGATLDLTYSAPADAPDTYLHSITAVNEQGNSVSRDFSTVVVWETASGEIAIGGVAPAVVGLSLSLSGTDLVIEATVTDDGPLSEISFSWSFDGGLSFGDPSANPAALTGYSETATGTVSLTVTDSDTSIQAGGLSTTITFVLPVGLFPDDVVVDETSGPPLLIVTNAYDRSVSIIDIQTDTEVSRISLVGTTQGVAVSPDGGYAWVANSAPAYTVSVIDLSDYTLANVFPVTGNPSTFPLELAFSSDGSEVYLTEHSGDALAILDAATGTVIDRITGLGVRTSGLAYDPATGIGYVMAGDSKTLSRIDLATRTITHQVTPGVTYPFGVGYSAARNEVYATGNTIAIHDATTLAFLRSFPIFSDPLFAVIGPDDRHLYVSQSSAGQVLKIDLDTPGGDIVGTIAVGTAPRQLVFSPDGSKLYVPILTTTSGSITIIDEATFTVTGTITVGAGANYAAIRP